jgi:hypothetical protein
MRASHSLHSAASAKDGRFSFPVVGRSKLMIWTLQ